MKTIETCLSPQLLSLHQVPGKTVVVVDILRATSSMITALAYGVSSITPVPTLADCRNLGEKGYITAGERGGQKVEGFDMGNSPFEFMDHNLQGKDLAFTTTNGSQAILSASAGHEVIIGSFLNLGSTIEYLKHGSRDLLILCAGWKGKFNIEDTLYAGALTHSLADHYQLSDDASLAAATLYQSVADNLLHFLARSSHAQRLSGFNNQRDLEFCLQRDQFSLNAVLHRDQLVKLESGS